MKVTLFSYFMCLLSSIYCYDSESSESNRIEVSPFYDTIIYSDIADIINEFGNNGISPFDIFASKSNSESQSDEDIENLLSEYQHYLEKAHQQKKNYIEKSKKKNKVPHLPRHDQYTKTKSGLSGIKHDEYLYTNGFYHPASYKFPATSYGNPLDVFIPINSKGKYMIKPETTKVPPKGNHEELVPFEKYTFNEKNMLNISPVNHKSTLEPIKSSCYCKNNHIPCECNCRQCLVRLEPMMPDPVEQIKINSLDHQKKNILQHPSPYESSFKKSEHFNDNNMKEMFSDNTLTVRIKVDLELPKPQDILGKYSKFHNRDTIFDQDDTYSKEITAGMNLPFPYFNFPVPMELFGYKKTAKYNKDESNPLHKITIHKKKKSRTNNTNKKHRKKVITYHNIKVEQQPLFSNHFSENINNTFKNETINNNVTSDTNTQSSNVVQFEMNSMLNKTGDVLNETQSTQTEENLNLMVNITNNSYNITEDTRKLENSIETDFPTNITNVTTKALREKRDVSNINISKSHSDPITIQSTKNNTTIEKKIGIKADKTLLSDVELLYWPNVTRSKGDIKSKNITTLILENEHKKTKLNMSKDTIRQNHTRVLEQAIFGDVDWDDVATVVPAFMSFVGKYIRGVLTFCSEKVCHSMNCANKTCLHRVCVPLDRLNNRGHCAGVNSTDSVASMESIMDLPSNIAFEMVDILQNKMLGKIFGKATFCINSKCITLVASKKTFAKYRCSTKELNAEGHCSNVKPAKVM